ncbi:MAG: ABC transporter ATP-binding protein [Alphaproteobacteria bacterium TMED87]|nr:ABC transporter ATP-binding protein [Rhodospirillaceae bacterium]OUV09158.1 MAG: ABC transporter ATP-binding protein [Alphaproteobacteria bacterium TMED87]|tara:strand:+ start:581 stop:1345 length:765 start_codon:yes stop_codon:yes gene_type:complete
MTNNKIQLINIHKNFNNKEVLKGLDLEIIPGESLVIIGGSGTGKSVLIKCILGIMTPDKGEILIDGKNILNLKDYKRSIINQKIGMLFQNAALFDSLMVWENVSFGLMQSNKMNRDEAKGTALKVLKKVGLNEKVSALYPSELSGGMQKRVGLARAIANSPEIIFFDEPTTGLDPIMADVINDLIIECVKDQGITALSITHDMNSARKISDRIAMLHEGRIVWSGRPNEIDNSKNQYVVQFINGNASGPIKMQI